MRTDRHRRLAAPFALGLVALLVAGCAAGGGAVASPSTDASSGPTPTPAPELPTNPDALVIQVRQEGGFVMPEYLFGLTPQFSVYADGRVITQGAQIMIYPGPLLPPLFVSRLDEATLLGLLAKADAAGLASGKNTAFPATMIADAPDTVIVVRGASGPTETRFGAFGMDQAGLPAAETDARAKAADFVAAVQAAVDAAGATTAAEPYVPRALRLLVKDYTPQPDLPQESVAWPLATPIATGGTAWFEGQPEMGRCVVVEGADVATLWPVLGAANALTSFVSEGKPFALIVRPLLPEEEPICP